jgi:hypothetical protein
VPEAHAFRSLLGLLLSDQVSSFGLNLIGREEATVTSVPLKSERHGIQWIRCYKLDLVGIRL